MFQPKRHLIFVSYSHKDKPWLDKLLPHLETAEEDGIPLWVDRTDIRPGDMWSDDIQRALDTARVAVALISPNFLASEYIQKMELPALLKAAKARQLRFLWIPLDHVTVSEGGIYDFQSAIDVAEPLAILKPDLCEQRIELAARIVRQTAVRELFVDAVIRRVAFVALLSLLLAILSFVALFAFSGDPGMGFLGWLKLWALWALIVGLGSFAWSGFRKLIFNLRMRRARQLKGVS